MVAWRMLRLKAGIQPSFGHLTLLRGALEGTSIARWLCDRAIGTQEGIRRAAGVQLADFDQRLRFKPVWRTGSRSRRVRPRRQPSGSRPSSG